MQLPGIQDPERAKELIGKTAVLEFKLVDDTKNVQDAIKDGPPAGDEILYGTSETGSKEPYLVESPVLMTGDVVTDARVRPGARLEGPYVAVELDNRGADIFDAMTAENVGRRLAIVLDNTVYSAPVIKERIPGGHVQITGRFSMDEAHDLAIVLRSGALPAPVEIEEERTVGPSLGRDSIRQGELSFVIGAGAVLIFMALYYSGAGLLADFGLSLNILLLICVMAALGATLTSARYRRYRADARHVGRCQRAGERADARGVAQRQIAARGGEARLRARVVGDPRLEHFDLRGGTDSISIWHRPGQRLRSHSMRWSADRPVFMYCGDASLVRLPDFDAQADPN